MLQPIFFFFTCLFSLNSVSPLFSPRLHHNFIITLSEKTFLITLCKDALCICAFLGSNPSTVDTSSLSTSLTAQLIKTIPAMQETPVQFLSREDPLEKGQTTHSSILGFPCGSAGKVSACNVGDMGLIPGLGRSSGEGNGYHSSIVA